MKKVLSEKYGRQYADEIMKKSRTLYRRLVEEADDIGADNPMAYNELFVLAFVAPYLASKKRIPPETIGILMRGTVPSGSFSRGLAWMKKLRRWTPARWNTLSVRKAMRR